MRCEGRLAANLVLAPPAQQQAFSQTMLAADLCRPLLPADDLPDHAQLELAAEDPSASHRSYSSRGGQRTAGNQGDVALGDGPVCGVQFRTWTSSRSIGPVISPA